MKSKFVIILNLIFLSGNIMTLTMKHYVEQRINAQRAKVDTILDKTTHQIGYIEGALDVHYQGIEASKHK